MKQEFQVAARPPSDFTPKERFLGALAGDALDRPPVWFMRQAGRYLPEYRELRERHSFHERVRDPALAARVTLQPLARFPLDAAVIFSDILVPLEAMGVRVTYSGGPSLTPPVRNIEDVDALRVPDPEKDLHFVGETIRQVKDAVPDHAVLGFAGAPFTLAAYLVQGSGSKGFPELMRFAHGDPEGWIGLMDRLVDAAAAHLVFQARAGATAVQLFDTWAELLALDDYRRLALPFAARVIEKVHDQADVPVIYFARGTAHLLPALLATGADAWSVDWRVDLERVRQAAPERVALQGNLDPSVLFAPPAQVRTRTRSVLESLGGRRHVFNLGHGILPGTPIEGVQAMVDTVVGWRA